MAVAGGDKQVTVLAREGAQRLHRPARHRHRQSLHPRSTAEAHWRVIDHAPTSRIDLDRPPMLVAKVEIEPITQATHTNMDSALGRIEMRLSLEDVQCRLQRV